MPPPEAPNSLDSHRQGSSSRNFPCTTSAAPTNVPALSPDEGSRRAEAGHRKTAPRRRAPPSASASETDSRPGKACPPPPHPTPPHPPHLPAATQSCSYYGSRCRPSHSRGGFAPGGLRGEAVVAAAAVASPGLTVAGRRPGTRRNPRPTRAAPATGLLTRPAAASVTPGRRGPAVCSGAGRRGLLGRAPGGGAGGEFAAPRLLPPARALPGSPEGRCPGADARLRTLGSFPPSFRFQAGSWTRLPWQRGASRAQRRRIPGASLQTPRLRTLTGSQSDSRGGTLTYVYQIYIHTYINILQAKLKGFFPTSQLKGPVPPRKTKGLPPLPFSACLDGI